MSSALRRPAFDSPTTHIASPFVFDPEYDVCFHHPGYPTPYDILLIIPGLDHPDGGIYHRVALWACGILANNEFDGWLTEDREGLQRVTTPRDGILRRRDYYFHVPGEGSHPYPIVPSFEDWCFPHNKLPAGWKVDIPRGSAHPTPRQSTLAEVVLSRDIRCRLTNHVEGTECAHLIPKNQSIWFQRNMMSRYCRLPRPGCDPVDNPRNVLLLRSDIHSSFDVKRFAFIPKPACAPVNNSELPPDLSTNYVVHLFNSPEPYELAALYHNVSLQPISGIAPEYLFARFAWTLFQYIPTFLQAGVPRRLAVALEESLEAGSNIKSTAKTWSAEQCRLMPLRAKSRSSSPKKRKPDDQYDEDDDAILGARIKRHRNEVPSFGTSLESDITTDGPWNSVSPAGWSLGTDISDEEDSRGRPYDQARKPNALLGFHSVTDFDDPQSP
ncbi:hypothetical protein N8T08_000735 [Aspergillus melleus]|uniref:Uncharacterized protein n=1 Tax=Aspergillus melleus TaxID=138277 RepID=A0ACC3APA5_9EURO|nr:hypothetical protein N8T08_000735 [Aspergillus melleus]